MVVKNFKKILKIWGLTPKDKESQYIYLKKLKKLRFILRCIDIL